MLFGFVLWYIKVQRPADRQLLQAIQTSEMQMLQAGKIQKKEVPNKSLIIRP